jgi:hypothetical protein
MNKEDLGGFAFPVPGGCGHDEGMTLRDYFAGKALAAMLTTPPAALADKDVVASQAYYYADAMLAEREK